MVGISCATMGAMVAAYGTLLTTPLITNDATRMVIVINSGCPLVASVATRANWLTTPVLTSAPTITNRPAKNSSVSHSTPDR
ncbi:Uncharacterised protein [Mycobacterium tuberculosis]|nr:Uncharacterised protein [Mycobacterium tuberculosis]